MAKLRWGILGTGTIAKALAKAIRASSTGELVAVGSRTAEKAEAFGKEFEIPRRYDSYEAVLRDPGVDAVYISLPNNLHAEWTIRCAEAGKHILCEKPFTSNHAEAMAALDAVQHAGVFLLEAFMYRCHPQTAKIVELVRSGRIGEVRLIHSHFSFNFGDQPANIRSSAALSGGGIMDVGCYTMSMARLVAGAALGLPGPAEPLEVKGAAHLCPPGMADTWATASVKFPRDILAVLSCGMQVAVPAPTVIYGSTGRIVVHNPWFPGTEPAAARLEVHVNGQKEPELLSVPGTQGLYTFEVDLVARHLADRQAPSPAMTWADSLGNIKALDAWRRSAGYAFACEKPEGLRRTAAGRPLKPRSGVTIPQGQVAGIAKPVSRIILGTMRHVLPDLPGACAMLDHYVEHGGNTLDTAHVYGSEADVGQWMKLRGVREQMVVIGKAGGTRQVTPAVLDEQLRQSLERLQTDYVDLFLMHRDNPDVPAGEFVDALNGHRQAGRLRAFGGSNWSVERLQAANDYAARHQLAGMAASSPHFSLAAWNEPMWADCVAATDRASRDWYARTRLPLMAWSSQANGFFAGRFKGADPADPALAGIRRVWFNDGNFERLRRVDELAARKGVGGAEIALAYVLAQPLEMYAMIGPQTIAEMHASFDALRVSLTAAECAWLESGC